METKKKINKTKGLVKLMRSIREEVSAEIMDMTYEQERTYLDELLASKEKGEASAANKTRP